MHSDKGKNKGKLPTARLESIMEMEDYPQTPVLGHGASGSAASVHGSGASVTGSGASVSESGASGSSARQQESKIKFSIVSRQGDAGNTQTNEGHESFSKLPQDTIYWTSASRRRREYEAIDAASNGIKGWMKRNVLPKSMGGTRHLPFTDDNNVDDDDDASSVRRYRVELDDVPEQIYDNEDAPQEDAEEEEEPRGRSRFRGLSKSK